MISDKYDYDARHYRFSRGHTGHIEPTEPLTGWGWEILRLTGITACCALLLGLAMVLA